MLHPWKWKWEKVPDLTSSGDRKHAWKGLTLWKSPKICEDPFLNPQWSLIKGQGFAETPRQWPSPALRPKESLRGDSNGDEKPGCHTPFSETLSLPLKVGGDRVPYIKHLWEVPKLRLWGRHWEALCHWSISQSVTDSLLLAQRGTTWRYSHMVDFLSLENSLEIEKPNENCLLPTSTLTASSMIPNYHFLLFRCHLGRGGPWLSRDQ